MPIVDKLRGFPVLQGFSLSQLAALAAEGEERDIKKDEILFREGDDAKELIFLLDGKLEVQCNGNKIAEVPGGNLVGEMGVLRNEKRIATVKAVEYCTFLSLTMEDFQRAIGEDPELGLKFYRNLSRILMEQLKKNNLLVEFFHALGS